MKVVIIEDERLAADDLRQTIHKADSSIEVEAMLKSVQEGKEYFSNNKAPDLIFSDIQLGDGLSFEIFSHLKVPVIFCTAFDEYALNAFKANGVDYMLKPFTLSSVTTALEKFKNLTRIKDEEIQRQYESIRRLFSASNAVKISSLLIHYKDIILPIKLDDIAYFQLNHDQVSLMTFDKVTYYPNKSLEELENLVGNDFFRANRQYLVNRKAVVKVSSMFSRKLSLILSLPVRDSVTISKEKASVFLKWLAGKV